jgi:hypothetical protein
VGEEGTRYKEAVKAAAVASQVTVTGGIGKGVGGDELKSWLRALQSGGAVGSMAAEGAAEEERAGGDEGQTAGLRCSASTK